MSGIKLAQIEETRTINRHRDCITLTKWLNRLDKSHQTPRPASSTPPTRCLCGAASTVRGCRISPIRRARLAKHPYLLGYVISEAARHPDFVDDFYSAERRKAARRSLERVEQQINERARRKKIAPVPADQFLVTLVGSCLWPFVAQPMIAEALGLTPKGLRDFMKRRRVELPALLKRTL